MNSEQIEKKRQGEIRLISEMISLYCKKKHGSSGALCGECKALSDYAISRITRCPFMEKKSFCSYCPVHCYSPEMREKIRTVMRISGPSMLLHHPLLSITHAVEGMKNKKAGKKPDA